MTVRKVLPLALCSLMLSASIARADMRSFVENNFAEIPEEDLSSVKSAQITKFATDAAIAAVAGLAARVPSTTNLQNEEATKKIGANLNTLSDKINAGKRLDVASEEALRIRLQEMSAATQLENEIGYSRQLAEKFDGLAANPQANAAELSQTRAELAEARAALTQAISQLPNANNMSVTAEGLERLGYFTSSDTIGAEYKALLARYNQANQSDTLQKLVADLQKESSWPAHKYGSKFDSEVGKFEAIGESAGFFRRVVVGGLGKIVFVAAVADGTSRGYLLYWAHRDPGLSPVLTTVRSLTNPSKDSSTDPKN